MTLVLKIYQILDVKRNEGACLKTGYRNKERYIFVLNRLRPESLGGTPLSILPLRALGGII